LRGHLADVEEGGVHFDGGLLDICDRGPEVRQHDPHLIKSRRLFIINTIPPQGIGAVSLISDGMD
jgi:hypothetical protein